MKLQVSIAEPIRPDPSFEERWKGPDDGLLISWERGRQMALEQPELAARALAGELVELPWTGGIAEPSKAKKPPKRYGCFRYLAMWQGLRGEDLDIDTEAGRDVVCTRVGESVHFTGDRAKFWKP